MFHLIIRLTFKDGNFRIKSMDYDGKLYSTFLFEKALIVCKSKGNTHTFRETLLINNFSIEENCSKAPSKFNLTGNHLSLYLTNTDNDKCYQITFKNKEEKRVWKEALEEAKRKVEPNSQRNQNHMFQLTNFDKQFVKCFVCDKYLLGIFYQGYKCLFCSVVAHQDCLSKIQARCNDSLKIMMRPHDKEKPVRSITVPVRNMPTPAVLNNLNNYPWYAPVDRNMADMILRRIPTPVSTTIYMLREKKERYYAISIKHRGVINHIKVEIQYVPAGLNHKMMYSIDKQQHFNSLPELVQFYSVNLLIDNFARLDTTLGIPYKNVLPTSISVAAALYDYTPEINSAIWDEQIELKKGQSYYVIVKDVNGLWKVFNSFGLIGYVPGSYLKLSGNLG